LVKLERKKDETPKKKKEGRNILRGNMEARDSWSLAEGRNK